jgi:polar amino acid transport system substrate-binding protein
MLSMIILLLLNQNILAKETISSALPKLFKKNSNYKILQLIADKLNYDLKLHESSFNKKLFDLKLGRIDLAVGLLKSDKREKYIYYIKKPYKNAYKRVFVTLKSKNINIKKYEDLYGLKIGVSKYSKYFKKFDQDKKLIKFPVSYYKSNFKNLLNDNIDTIILGELMAKTILKQDNFKDKINISDYQYLSGEPVYIGISKKSKLMNNIDEVEEKLLELIDNNISKMFKE